MDTIMPAGAERPLTEGEWAALSPGLAQALHAAGVEPRILARAALGARIAGLWRGSTPILAWRRSIYWPGAPLDASAPWSRRSLATLQHELHHLWEYATGDLKPLRYAFDPRDWTYGYRLGPQSAWSDFGAEQRASIAEHLWLIECGLMADRQRGALHRRVLPWAG